MRFCLVLIFLTSLLSSEETITYKGKGLLWEVSINLSEANPKSYCSIEKITNRKVDKKTGIIRKQNGAVKIYPYQKSEDELIFVIKIFDDRFLNFVTSENSFIKYFYPKLNPEVFFLGFDYFKAQDFEDAIYLINKDIKYEFRASNMYLYIPASQVYEYENKLRNIEYGSRKEVLLIKADSSYFSEDYEIIIDMQNFREWITPISSCHLNKKDYAKELIRLNKILEEERQKTAKVEKERKLIEEEKRKHDLFSKLNKLNKKCVASGGIWNKNNREIKEVHDFTSLLYCEIPRRYRYARSSESDEYEEDEEELNDAMFDEGTPQCDEGTWYEENGYC